MFAAKHNKANYSLIIDLIKNKSHVLDLGCGTGELLNALIKEKKVRGKGADINENNIISCIQKGLSVFQLNLDEGLKDYQNNSFDYVVLSQTIQIVQKPHVLIEEMLRVGKKVIVSFPNFGSLKLSLYLLLKGQMPKSDILPFEWFDTPNIHLLTIKDFRKYCKNHSITINDEVFIAHNTKKKNTPLSLLLANYIMDEAIFVISRNKR